MKTRSMKLTCPFCGENEAITIDLNNFNSVVCASCSEERTPEQFAEQAKANFVRWANLITWIGQASLAD